MNKKLKETLKYVLLFAIGAFVLWFTFKDENIHDIWNKIRQADTFYISLSLLLGFLAFISRAFRWILLIEPAGYTARKSQTSYALMIGYFANLALPRMGEFTRCGMLSKKEKIPFDVLLGTVIVERVIDLLMLLCSIGLVLFFEWDLMTRFIYTHVLTDNSFLVQYKYLILIGCFILFILFYISWKRINKNQNNLPGWVIRIKKIVDGIYSGMKTVITLKKRSAFIAHTFFIWICYFFMTYTCFFALPATSNLGTGEGLFVLVAGGLGMSAPVQGGIGAYHWIVSQALMLFGISATDGITYATLVHTYQTLLVIVAGIISLFLYSISRNKKSNHELS